MMIGVDPEFFVMPLLDEEVAFSFHPDLAAMALFATAAFIGGGIFLKMASVRDGGAAVAEGVGGVEVNAGAEDPQIRRYVNIVEEMSLASGVPVPRTFVLEDQLGINGFAAGFSINDAAIAVTAGALEHLNRDELQALVAHEFSHILHGDMKLNVRLIGILHGVMSIYTVGHTIVEGASATANTTGRGVRTRQPLNAGGINPLGLLIAFPGAILMAIGFGGLLGSRLIKAGISRQREFLADASAIQYTRNPEALAGALKKIGGCTYGSVLQGAGAEEVSHMCFGEASSNWLTHPPLEERIQAVDPTFNPDLGYRVLEVGEEKEPPASAPEEQESVGGVADEIVSMLGEATPESLIYCGLLLESIPEPLMEARGSLAGAVAASYLLLLDDDRQTRKAQAEIIQTETSPSVAREAQKLWPSIRKLDDELRLPLMDLLFPMLRQMTEEQEQEFMAVAERLIQVDDSVNFREFILERVVLHRLRAAGSDKKGRAAQFNSFSGVSRDLENILSAVAYVSSEDPAHIKQAFVVGRECFPPVVAKKLEFRERSRWTFEQIGASLERLAASSPAIKRATIDACAHSAMSDGEVVAAEAQILRAICDHLDAPLPPLMPGQS